MTRIDYGAGLVIDIPEGMTILEASLQHGPQLDLPSPAMQAEGARSA